MLFNIITLYNDFSRYDFEKELWDAANELRGAVLENNYKIISFPKAPQGTQLYGENQGPTPLSKIGL